MISLIQMIVGHFIQHLKTNENLCFQAFQWKTKSLCWEITNPLSKEDKEAEAALKLTKGNKKGEKKGQRKSTRSTLSHGTTTQNWTEEEDAKLRELYEQYVTDS
jgi:hypothetical protein